MSNTSISVATICISSSHFNSDLSFSINEPDFPSLASLDSNTLGQTLLAGIQQGIVIAEQNVRDHEVRNLRHEVQRIQQTLSGLPMWLEEWIPRISETMTKVVQQTLDPMCTTSEAYHMVQSIRDAMHPDIISSTIRSCLGDVLGNAVEPVLSHAVSTVVEPSLRMLTGAVTGVLTDWTKQMGYTEGHNEGTAKILEKSPQKGFLLEDCVEEWLRGSQKGCDVIQRTGTVVQEGGGTGKKGDFCIDIDPMDCREGTRIVIEVKSALPNGKQSWTGKKTGYEGYLRQAIQQRGATYGILVVSSRDAMNATSRSKLNPFYMTGNMLFCACDNCGDVIVPIAYWYVRQILRYSHVAIGRGSRGESDDDEKKIPFQEWESDVAFCLTQLKQFVTMKGTLTKLEEACSSQCFLLRKQLTQCEQDLKTSLQSLQRKMTNI